MRPPSLQPLVPGLFMLAAEKDGRFPYSHAFVVVVEARDRCILEMLDRPHTIVELIEASPIYGGRGYALGVLDDWEGQMIRKRLERLERRGRAHRTGPSDEDLGDPALDGNHAEGLQGAAAKPDRFHDRTRWLRR